MNVIVVGALISSPSFFYQSYMSRFVNVDKYLKYCFIGF